MRQNGAMFICNRCGNRCLQNGSMMGCLTRKHWMVGRLK